MGFDASDLLGNLFGGPTRAAAVPGPDDRGGQDVGCAISRGMAPSPAGAEPAGAEPVAAGVQLPLALDGTAQLCDWVRRPDSRGRMGWQPADTPQAVSWEDLPEPGPGCPVCGSLENWQDPLGHTRCGGCEVETLRKAIQLRDRAAMLPALARQRGPAYKPAPEDCAPCVPAGSVASKHPLAGNAPQGHVRSFGGAAS